MSGALRLSPALPLAERPHRFAQPVEDRLRQAAAALPDVAAALRGRALAPVLRHARAEAAWAARAADAPLDAARTLAEVLRARGFAAAPVGRAFALLRVLGARLLGMAAYDVQLLGAHAMLRGHLAEMATGEGKTLTASFAAATAGLAGWPVHVVTVNDYLARRDAEMLGPFYAAIGLTTGLVVHGQTREERRAAYACDIVYGSNKEITFDYLRDRILRRAAPSPLHLRLSRLTGRGATLPGAADAIVMRGLHFAIVDEADSVLIDEARTPLIISEGTGGGDADGAVAAIAIEIARALEEGTHYEVDHVERQVALTEAGGEAARAMAAPLGGDWRAAFVREERVCKALSALLLHRRDEHYLVRDGKVQIVDEFTGRVMADRFWNDGLHQMVEAKEGCDPTGAKSTVARLTYQRFFPRYRHLCGMSGTLREVARELRAVYGVRIVRIPTHRTPQRIVEPTTMLPDETAKWTAIAERTRALSRAGRPVLIGTRTVAASLRASAALAAIGLDHALLNAEQDAREAEIIGAAGAAGRITIATNMAGRGTDIRLADGVAALGGLAVILSERHEAGRIDRQLAGRCARQGEPGSVHPILSLSDPLLLPLRRGRIGRALLAAAARHPRLAVWLLDRMQRRAERLHAQVRRALLRTDSHHAAALAFSGQGE